MKSLSHCRIYGIATQHMVKKRRMFECADAGECRNRMVFDGKNYCADRLLKEDIKKKSRSDDG